MPMRLRNLNQKNGLVERVVGEIEQQIIKGRLRVGEKLPPEREMAERVGVSRTVLRESVRILVTRGLLETRHGVGTTVRRPTPAEVVRPLAFLLKTGGPEVTAEHLHQVRSILEVENAGLAAIAASPEDVRALESCCEAMEAAQNAEEFARCDARFHARIAAATHNPLLPVLLQSIEDLMSEVRRMVAGVPGLRTHVMPGHREICRAIRAHDADGSRIAMQEHLRMALALQREYLA
ncbi:MAG: FadR/GntR family transcriptional regulator [Bryobacteraceae bacterium]|nr:FadR/GntR family transcriptional regulator [Bryobacteraceae bacterium]